MSYSAYFKPVQKVAYNYVDDSTNPDDLQYDRNQYDKNQYDKNQSEIIKSQNQNQLGTIPAYVNKQPHSNIIDNIGHNRTNPPEPPKKPQQDQYHKYDPYYDYLRKIGAYNDNSKSRINTRSYAINSNVRSVNPQISTKDRVSLQTNALSYNTVAETVGISTTTRDILSIYCPGHSVAVGDQITLSGVTGQSVSIKSIYNDINGNSQNAVIFTNYSTSVVIKCNFDTIINNNSSQIDTSMSFDPSFKVGLGINYDELLNYDTSDMTVTLSGFDISSMGIPFVGNIPINFLNSTHRIYFTNPNFTIVNGVKVYSPDTLINIPDRNNNITKITGFYINLDVAFNNTISSTATSTTLTTLNTQNIQINTINPMIINITFNYIGGIPINMLNAEFPVDQNNVNGYHHVHSVTANNINILLNKKTYYTDPTHNRLSTNIIPFGGSGMEISKLDNVISGNTSPNNYTVMLPNEINNVIMAKLTSITIPNTAKVFTNIVGYQNNKIYWQNQDDGDFIYSVEINPGNYATNDLQAALQEKIYSIPKKYTTNSNKTTSYTNYTVMVISINIITNKVSFSCFKEAVLRKPIQDISPPIPSVGDGASSYTLTISQSNHGLLVGDVVTFAGFVTTNGIPASVLNAIHVITSVINSDTYTIVISNFNLSNGTRTATGGGFSAKVLVPSAFKLLFNYPDTIGTALGFRKVGQPDAITPFSKTINNSDPYANEIVTQSVDGISYVTDTSGNKMVLTQNSLKLDGYSYIMMVIRNFNNIINLNGNKKITSYFAKINLRGLPGTVVFDDFICPQLIFNEPINVSQLDISFYTPDGQLYDFCGLDHDFMIEITNIDYIPDNTEIISTLSMF